MNSKTVAILGATGMLGSATYDELKDRYELTLVVRDKNKIKLLEDRYGGTARHKVVEFDAALLYRDFAAENGQQSSSWNELLTGIGDVRYVINAIGVTIPFVLENPALTFFINGGLPHLLASAFRGKLIQITTDCAYSGSEGFPYDEKSPKSPVDIYGLSKILGEPAGCLTLRTSIVGRELEGHTGLLDWFLAQQGKTVTGFANQFWNGITAKQFAKICDKVMSDPGKFPRSGLFHVFSTTISKYEMLLKFKEKFSIDCEVSKDETRKLNRTLATIYDFNKELNLPAFDEMLKEI